MSWVLLFFCCRALHGAAIAPLLPKIVHLKHGIIKARKMATQYPS